VTFLALTGDSGAPGGFPGFDSNVVGVGGTSLVLTSGNVRVTESAWSSGGGGISTVESKPVYQNTPGHGSVLSSLTKRGIPDVSFLADPNTGVVTYDPYNGGWFQIGGTSLSCPCMAGLVAIADQMRTAARHGTLDGVTQTLPGLYNLPGNDFLDITTGNNGYAAGAGYDLATGLGVPNANLFVTGLANYAVPEPSTLALLGIAGIGVIGVFGRKRLRSSQRG